MRIRVPEVCLVVLVGPAGCGKSTFARKHFKSTEIVSSDFCRALVSDDEANQAASHDAFELMHFIANKRLAAGRLTVIDATNVKAEYRKPLVEIARRNYADAAALVFDLPEEVCQERNRHRPDRRVPPYIIANQYANLAASAGGIRAEGFRHVYTLDTAAKMDSAIIERFKLPPNRGEDPGPFDIIGDIHGCADELETLLGRLGYARGVAPPGRLGRPGRPGSPLRAPGHAQGRALGAYVHPDGRKVVSLGDIVDRGPRIVETYRILREMAAAGSGLMVEGNHDNKLMRKLRGHNVKVAHGLEMTVAEIEALPAGTRGHLEADMVEFLGGLPSHLVLDGGGLVVAHAGLKRAMHGRDTREVRQFALYGETTGELDEFGIPVRCNWVAEYHSRAYVVYGHTPVVAPEWYHRTMNVDTGCVFGGKLTALRYPEMETVSVAAARAYYPTQRQFFADAEEMTRRSAGKCPEA